MHWAPCKIKCRRTFQNLVLWAYSRITIWKGIDALNRVFCDLWEPTCINHTALYHTCRIADTSLSINVHAKEILLLRTIILFYIIYHITRDTVHLNHCKLYCSISITVVDRQSGIANITYRIRVSDLSLDQAVAYPQKRASPSNRRKRVRLISDCKLIDTVHNKT